MEKVKEKRQQKSKNSSDPKRIENLENQIKTMSQIVNNVTNTTKNLQEAYQKEFTDVHKGYEFLIKSVPASHIANMMNQMTKLDDCHTHMLTATVNLRNAIEKILKKFPEDTKQAKAMFNGVLTNLDHIITKAIETLK